MDIFLVLAFIFIFSVLFYAINLYMPTKKKIKYIICAFFILFGFGAWLYVWFGNGWLASAVYGTVSLILGVVLFILAFLFDFVDRRKRV